MTDDLVRRARSIKLYRGAVEELAAHLPADTPALSALLADLVVSGDSEAFTPLILAALHAGHPIPADLLIEGAALLPHPGHLFPIAWKMTGNVADALVKAVARGTMGLEREAASLFLAAAWCLDQQRPADLPPVIARARILARNPFLGPETKLTMASLALLTGDPGLETLTAVKRHAAEHDIARRSVDVLTALARSELLSCLPSQPPPTAISGYTVRRAVARIGRNDPCPCGSGKKYNRCCFEKDQIRLNQSSPVAGLTVEEYRSEQERFLTIEKLQQMRSYEVARLDPAKVAPNLLPVLVNRLLGFNDTECVVRLFETTGIVEPIAEHWYDALNHAASHRQLDLLRRLIALKPDFDPNAADVDLEVRLALLASTSNPSLDLIEAEALAALQPNPEPGALVTLGYVLLDSAYPALGILVARGIVPIAPPFDSEILHDVLLETRDRLKLDFRDPIDPVVEQHLDQASEHAYEESAALSQARRNIEEKNLEVRRLRQELDRLSQDLQKRSEQPPPPQPAPTITPPADATPPPPPPAADPALKAMRQRIEGLKEELHQRHAERNQLRRELANVTQELEAVRAKTSQPAPTPSSPGDPEATFIEAEFEGNQPVRIPDCTKRFAQSIEGLPKPVARAALLLIGRLAAGQPAAFVGLKKLAANPHVLRQRVGADHRLLFSLTSDSVQILALVNRRDLDRQIRNLFAP